MLMIFMEFTIFVIPTRIPMISSGFHVISGFCDFQASWWSPELIFMIFDDFGGPAGRPNPRDPCICAVFSLISEDRLPC